MTIKQKIIGESLGTSLLVAAVGVLSAVSMLRIGSVLRTVETTDVAISRNADQLEGAAARIDGLMDGYRTAVQAQRQQQAHQLKDEVDSAFKQIALATTQLEQTLRFNPAAAGVDLNLLESIKEQAQVANGSWSKLHSEIDGSGDAQPDVGLMNDLSDATGDLMRTSLDLQKSAKDDMMRGMLAAQHRVTTSVSLLISAAFFAVVLSLGMGVLVVMPLARRLARLRDGAEEVGRGNFQTQIKLESNDEIGQLAAAFNEMSGKLRRSRDEIRDSESKFRELADNIHEVFWVSNPACTELQYVSPAYEQIWGRTCDSVYRDLRSFSQAIVPEHRQRVLAALAKAATDGIDEHYRIVRPDGSIRWIHDRGFPVRDEAGKVKRIVGIAEDTTIRSHAEVALRQSEAMLIRAQQVANIGSWDWDPCSGSLLWSDQYYRISDLDPREFIPSYESFVGTIHPEDREKVKRAVENALAGRERYRVTYRLIARDQSVRTILAQGDVDRDETGKVIRMVGTALDITDRTKADDALRRAHEGLEQRVEARTAELQQAVEALKRSEVDLKLARDTADAASRAKSEFLANMSHEIRTPLNGVVGMSDLLLDTDLDERQRRFAELIKSSGASLCDLINDILDFSKIEARKLEIESIDFDLHIAVEDVLEMMLIKAGQKGLDLGCMIATDVPRQVKGDPQRVKQILLNLINNAIKFTESGSISTRLTLENQSQDQVAVRFSITDTGTGIPADRMDRLFKSFSQLDNSTTRTYGGTGLGLAISKQLAELMGGSIGVESAPGHGSTFWFTVKFGLESFAQEPIPSAAINPRGLRVLAVHGDPAMREILHSQLISWKLQGATASSGDEAMRLLTEAATRSQPYDVAIFDAELPDIGTLELGMAIKARSEIAGTILLILLPADSPLEPTQLSAAGFSGHLTKPVRQSRLYDSILDAMAPTSLNIPGSASKLTRAGSASNPLMNNANGARILIAEDNRVNQIVATEVLSKHGYTCDIADNGINAMAAALAGGYDLILMDCSMPGMDGFEATRHIRRAEAADTVNAQRHIPIIALTANAIKGDRDQCLAAGMDDYVSKPVDPGHLIASIQKLLAQSSAKSATALEMASQTGAPIAIEALLNQCMGNLQTAASVLDEFEREAVDDLAQITRRAESGDCAGLAKVAHSLKGASAILKASEVAALALQLETMGRAGVLTAQDQLLNQLNKEIQRCLDYLPTARAEIARRTAAKA